MMPNICEGGDCVNTDGSFRCECPIGYVLDSSGMKCIDDNECISNPSICGNGTCTNIIGSFECSCSDGFAPGPMQVWMLRHQKGQKHIDPFYYSRFVKMLMNVMSWEISVHLDVTMFLDHLDAFVLMDML